MHEGETPHGSDASPAPVQATGPDARPVAVLAGMLFAARVRGAAQAAGATVITAERADRFLEQAKNRRARLLIVDLEMPGQDVAALIRALKADDRLRDVPLVGFASHMNVDAIAAGRAAGADRVLARSAFLQALPGLLAPP